MASYLAPAKINLTLEVLARREDGYHALRSVMVPLSLADAIAIEPSERFAFECDAEGLGGDDNLVVRAAAALGALPPVRITLTKHIPSQAGLGGGSSATPPRSCARRWTERWALRRAPTGCRSLERSARTCRSFSPAPRL